MFAKAGKVLVGSIVMDGYATYVFFLAGIGLGMVSHSSLGSMQLSFCSMNASMAGM